MRRACLALALLTLWLPATAQTLEIPGEFRMAVSTARARGVALYVHDASAARASDELKERKVFQGDSRLLGWLTDIPPQETAVVVTFVGTEDGKLSALYRVRVPAGDAALAFEKLKPALPLNESQQARWRARQLALEDLRERNDLCASRYNTVVLSPDPAPDGLIHVYLLAATDKAGEIVAGGHFRYDYSPDGSKLEAQRKFTKACFTVEPPDEKQGETAAFFLTHLLDPTPTEIHVFLTRLHNKGIYVGTEFGTWGVIDGDIALLERREK
jgi:hypothetical protein